MNRPVTSVTPPHFSTDVYIYQHRLEQEHAVSNAAEARRRAKRVASTLLSNARRASQRSVKFIRWLRHALQENLTVAAAVPRLTTLCASL